ncbi:MAG: VWA domain-containing protein [bacterium]|nr:VWA domain-containing protein [bacterium]
MMLQFQHPAVFWLIIPVVAALVFIILKDFVKFRNKSENAAYHKRKKPLRILMLVSRIIVYSALIAALSVPYISKDDIVPGKPALDIFVDKSKSFELFDNSVADDIRKAAEKELPVSVRTIAEANRSAIGDSLLSNIQGDDSVLIITDGNNNYGRSLGDMMVFASMLNTTISTIRMNPVEKDAVVYIEGQSTTTIDVENEFTVVIEEVGELDSYSVSVMVDNNLIAKEKVDGPKTISFSNVFEEGYHKITAEITADDYFPENNVFRKVVKVEPKPKVLFVSKKDSHLQGTLAKLYDLRAAQSVPAYVNPYSAIILNDIPAYEVPVTLMTEFVTDGNGLFVIGGRNSFNNDAYKTSHYKIYEALLPTIVGTGEMTDEEKDVNVVIVLDISGTTGGMFGSGTFNSVSDVEKSLALGILDDLSEQSRVGVVAFNIDAYDVSDGMGTAYPTRKRLLEDRIKTLVSGQGTDISVGIMAAKNMLASSEGSKNIILISDGRAGVSFAEDLRVARIAAATGANVFTVGVGELTNKEHMRNMAKAGNGVYFEPTETQRLKLVLGPQQEEMNETYDLEKINNYHFITGGVDLDAKINGHNFVVPKENADTLVATSSNHPILNVWRFGLGRIAVLATDDGSGWAGELLSKKNAGLISKTVNWAIGDLSRKKSFDVSMDDSYLGETIQVRVISDSMPENDLNFSKVGDRLYTSSFTPDQEGFYQVLNGVVAVNYPKELLETGINPELKGLVAATGGEVFNANEIEKIVGKVRSDSRRIETRTISYSWILTLIALLIFLSEVCARRVIENRNINKQ